MAQSVSPNPEEWSKEQKEIWAELERHWQLLTTGKVKEFLEYIHPEFRGFGHESPLMLDKKWLSKWVGFWCETTQFPIYYISPISCGVFDTVAILQYYLFTIEKNAEGAGRSVRRYTMTWQKKDGTWRVLASHNNVATDQVRGR